MGWKLVVVWMSSKLMVNDDAREQGMAGAILLSESLRIANSPRRSHCRTHTKQVRHKM